MKKKFLLMLSLMAFMVCLLAISVSAVVIDGIDYSFSGAEATVTAANSGCELTEVNIPETVTYEGKTYTVAVIANSAFKTNKTVTKITTPSTIRAIGEHAFREMKALQTVVLRANEGFKKFSDAEFYQCYALQSVDMSGCKGLTGIGDGGTYDDTFTYCSSLNKVVLPKTITYIGVRAFFECKALTSIENLDFTQITYVGVKAFWGPKISGDVVLPKNATYVGDHAFRGTNITSIVMRMGSESTQTAMNDATFYGCSQLKYVVLPDNITNIGQYTFSGCSKLEYLIIGKNVSTVSTTSTFSGCNSLKAIIYAGSEEDFNNIKNSSVFGVKEKKSFSEYVHGSLPETKTLYYGATLCTSCNGILGGEAFKAESFLKEMKISCECLYCDSEIVSKTFAPIFEDLGYSTSSINGKCSILQGFKVNYESLNAYKENLPAASNVTIGVLAVLDSNVDTSAFDENGKALDGVVAAEIKSGHNYFEVKVLNLSQSETLENGTAQTDVMIHLSAYLKVGSNIYYVSEGHSDTILGEAVSYNTIK